MRYLLPNASEVAIFAGLAAICAAIVGTMDSQIHDLVFAIMAFPIFVFAAILGLRRNWARQVAVQPVTIQSVAPTQAQSAEA